MPRYLRRYRGGSARWWFAAVMVVIAAACDVVPPNGPLRFGQTGEIRVTVESPLYLGAGSLQQVLTWRSDGTWRVFEEIGYRGTVGEEHVERAPGLPFEYASLYASLIQKLNDDEGFKLIGFPALDEIQNPECRSGMSRGDRSDVRRAGQGGPGMDALRGGQLGEPDDARVRARCRGQPGDSGGHLRAQQHGGLGFRVSVHGEPPVCNAGPRHSDGLGAHGARGSSAPRMAPVRMRPRRISKTGGARTSAAGRFRCPRSIGPGR